MCCSCGGADSRARHCTGETNGPSLKWQMPPNCHCKERSDVAISGRHSQIVQAAMKTYRPIASVAALTERLVQGYSTAQGHWCTARHPDVSLRGAKRRGNLGKALADRTGCHENVQTDCVCSGAHGAPCTGIFNRTRALVHRAPPRCVIARSEATWQSREGTRSPYRLP